MNTTAELPLSSPSARPTLLLPAPRTSRSLSSFDSVPSHLLHRRASSSSTTSSSSSSSSSITRSLRGTRYSSPPSSLKRAALPSSRSLPVVSLGKEVGSGGGSGNASFESTLIDSFQQENSASGFKHKMAFSHAAFRTGAESFFSSSASSSSPSSSAHTATAASDSTCFPTHPALHHRISSSGSSSSDSNSNSTSGCGTSNSGVLSPWNLSPRIEDVARMEAPAPWEVHVSDGAQDGDSMMHDVQAQAAAYRTSAEQLTSAMSALSASHPAATPSPNGGNSSSSSENGATGALSNGLLPPVLPLLSSHASAMSMGSDGADFAPQTTSPMRLPSVNGSSSRPRRVPLAEIPLWYADVRGEYLRRAKQERSGLGYSTLGFSPSAHVLANSTSHNVLHYEPVPYVCPTTPASSSSSSSSSAAAATTTASGSDSTPSGLLLLGLSSIDEGSNSNSTSNAADSSSLFVLADEAAASPPRRKEMRAVRRRKSSSLTMGASASAGSLGEQQQQQQQRVAHSQLQESPYRASKRRLGAHSRAGR
ncbi:hypothetical protein OC834_001876 [Tilletia horrida]|nr:hypothetical protein OC834_001876 [Tilletia horrida]